MRSSSGARSSSQAVARVQVSGCPIPTSLTDLVSARLAALSADVREVLEPVALLSEPTVSIVEAVASDGATVRGRLRAAEAAAIVELNEERVRFSHPLLAARVEAELDPRRRRSLHRRLAELVGDPEQRARHLALGANGASARVADELETASVTAAARGAPGAAAELAELSVSLTPAAAGGRVRRRRQLLAAGHHFASGDPERRERSSRSCSSSCSLVPSGRRSCCSSASRSNRRSGTVGAAPGAGVRRGRVRSSIEGGDRHTAYQ